MKDELTGIIEALKYSMQMEVDGKKFYMLSCAKSDNQVGKDLFTWLSEQEDYHLQRFQEIYKSIIEKKGWPVAKVRLDKHASFRTIFAEAIGSSAKSVKATKGDLPAADKAIEMEIKSRDYYTEQAGKASSNEGKTFFTAVSTEEQGHYLALVDYKEYVTDPVGFLTRTEHHSIDGE